MLIQESNQTGAQMFAVLSNPSGAGGAVELQSRIAEAATQAGSTSSRTPRA